MLLERNDYEHKDRQTDRQTDVTQYIITTSSCSTSQVVVSSSVLSQP